MVGTEKNGTSSNSFALIQIDNIKKKSKVITSLNPEWNQMIEFKIRIQDYTVKIIINIKILN